MEPLKARFRLPYTYLPAAAPVTVALVLLRLSVLAPVVILPLVNARAPVVPLTVTSLFRVRPELLFRAILLNEVTEDPSTVCPELPLKVTVSLADV